MIPNPVVTYTNPNTTGTLTYTPVPGNTGTATITLTVMNSGGTANGGVNTFSETFVITVTPINQSPTLDPINTPAPIFENAPAQTIGLTGISNGANVTQFVIVTAVSSNPALIPNPTVNYTSPSTTGSLTYTPVANTSGTATITVTVSDNGSTANGGITTFSQSFTVTVTAVNQPPTINAIAPVTILENSGTQTLNLAGIGPGPGDKGETVTITATSSNPTLIPIPAITYTNPSTTGIAHLRADALRQRLVPDHPHPDGQRRHRQRRQQHDHRDLHRGGPAGQPAAHARPDHQPRPDPRECRASR